MKRLVADAPLSIPAITTRPESFTSLPMSKVLRRPCEVAVTPFCATTAGVLPVCERRSTTFCAAAWFVPALAAHHAPDGLEKGRLIEVKRAPPPPGTSEVVDVESVEST